MRDAERPGSSPNHHGSGAFERQPKETVMVESMVQPKRTEGPVAKQIEDETSRVPSDWFLWAALGSIGISMMLQASNKRESSLFVGQWVPTFLLLGVYNKIVKVAGHDRQDTAMANR
jgi:hypothetical protein